MLIVISCVYKFRRLSLKDIECTVEKHLDDKQCWRESEKTVFASSNYD